MTHLHRHPQGERGHNCRCSSLVSSSLASHVSNLVPSLLHFRPSLAYLAHCLLP